MINIGVKICWIFVPGYFLFLEAHSFPRAMLLENHSLLGKYNDCGQISDHFFSWNAHYCLHTVWWRNQLKRKEVTRYTGLFNQWKASLELPTSRILACFLAMRTNTIHTCTVLNYLHGKDPEQHLAWKSSLEWTTQACWTHFRNKKRSATGDF